MYVEYNYFIIISITIYSIYGIPDMYYVLKNFKKLCLTLNII